MSLVVIPNTEIYSLLNTVKVEQTPLERTEMAIDTYIHANPLVRWLMWQRLRTAAGFIVGNKHRTALDFGCGFGLLLPTLARLAENVYAIDLFPQYAKQLARDKRLDVRFIGSVGALPDGSLDLILATDVIEHLDDPEGIIAQFKAKLAPDGQLIIAGPTETIFYRIGKFLSGWQKKGEYHNCGIKDIELICVKLGFNLVKRKALPFPFLPPLFHVLLFKPGR